MSSSKKPLYSLAVPSTTFEAGGAFYCRDSIRFEYFRNSVLFRAGIRFSGISAMRKLAERCCTVWHIEEVYDVLAEVHNSDWLPGLITDLQHPTMSPGEWHHYIIYLDSSGCFEFAARSWAPIEEEAGSWIT
jgi:hypothetical protein